MTGPEIACIGEAMIEVSLDDKTPDRAGLGFAGDTLNTAIYLRRLLPDARVAFVTKLGRDRLSGRMEAFMQGERLDTSLIGHSDTRLPGLYAISTDPRGERSFMYWRGDSAARTMFRPPSLSLEALGGFAVIYFSAISLAILPAADRARFLEWLPGYRHGGGQVAFDSNYRPALWPDVDTARADVAAAWRQTDIALPSLDDEQALFDDPDEAAVLRRLAGYGVRSGALKRGAQGPLALDCTPAGPFPPAPRVIDSTAAGDSFNGGYLAARLAGRTETDCLRAGHDLAVRVLGVRGAILPRDDIGTAP